MTLPGLLFWLFLIFSMVSRGPWIYYLTFASWSFGTLAVLPPALVGSSITPAWVCALAFTAREISRVGYQRFLQPLLSPKILLPLTLCTIYGAVASVLMPLLFEGRFEVVIMRLNVTGPGIVPLAFSVANITQTLYFVICTAFTAAVYSAANSPGESDALFASFRIGAFIAIVTGFMDLGLSQVGGTALLEPFRNATYSLMIDDNVMGMKRTVGLMSEASSYGGLILSFLTLFAYAPVNWTPLTGGAVKQFLLTATLCFMIYLSTSTGSIVMLGIVGVILTLNFVRNTLLSRQFALAGLFGVLVALTICVGVVLFYAPMAEFAQKFIESIVLTKTQSQSYIERSSWNRIAYEAFLNTYGLGAGLGSARSSSWFIAVLGNIGLPGALLFAALFWRIAFTRGIPEIHREKLWSVKLAIFINCVGLSLSSTTANFGLPVSFFVGLAFAFIESGSDARVNWSTSQESANPV